MYECKCVTYTQCALQQMHNMFCNKYTLYTRHKYTMCLQQINNVFTTNRQCILQQINNVLCNKCNVFATKTQYIFATNTQCNLQHIHNVHKTQVHKVFATNTQCALDTNTQYVLQLLCTPIYTLLNALTVLGIFTVL